MGGIWLACALKSTVTTLKVSSMQQAWRAHYKRPSVIIAHTIPGKGVDFMEYDYQWHGMPPNSEQAKEALDRTTHT